MYQLSWWMKTTKRMSLKSMKKKYPVLNFSIEILA